MEMVTMEMVSMEMVSMVTLYYKTKTCLKLDESDQRNKALPMNTLC